MFIYNLDNKQEVQNLKEKHHFVLANETDSIKLPFYSNEYRLAIKNNPRPILHMNGLNVYSFKVYQDDLKPIDITLVIQNESIYLISDISNKIKLDVSFFIQDENFISSLLWYFLDEFYTTFSDYEDMLIELEDSLSSGSFENVSLDSLSEMKHDAMMADKNMRRIQYITFNVLQENKELEHLHNLVLNNSDYTKHIVDYVNHLINLYNSMIAEKTNNTINKLTILAFLATPVSILSGIYGMNFINMPGIYNEYGFYILMAITLVSMWFIYLII